MVCGIIPYDSAFPDEQNEEVLRRAAESTMLSIARTIFGRLCEFNPADEEAKLRILEDEPQHGDLSLSVPTTVTSNSEAIENAPSPGLQGKDVKHTDIVKQEPALDAINAQSKTVEGSAPSIVPPRPCRFKHESLGSLLFIYFRLDGLPALLELLRVLVNILDPNDQVHTDSTRLTALSILNATIEACGTRIGDYPSLVVLILDHGCKYLFQLARSDNPAVLQGALRAISSLFETMRPHLKLQQELFLAFSIDRLATPPLQRSNTKKRPPGSPRPGTPATSTPTLGPVDTELELEKGSPVPSRPPVQPARGDTRDLMLETLSQISRHPSFMVDLYTNYDCDINCENLFERLIEFLTKVGLPRFIVIRYFIPFAGSAPLAILVCFRGTTAAFTVPLLGYVASVRERYGSACTRGRCLFEFHHVCSHRVQESEAWKPVCLVSIHRNASQSSFPGFRVT